MADGQRHPAPRVHAAPLAGTSPTGQPPRGGTAATDAPHRGGSLINPRWVIAAVLLLSFVSALALDAYVNASTTPDALHRVGAQTTVPQTVIDGGPIIDPSGDHPISYRLPRKTIALTFDDGPDPVWTPRILDVLRRNQVPGTFFVIGSQVARYPTLTRRIAEEGNELGAHSFTHPDLTTLPTWRRQMELAHTQMAIAEAADVHTSLLRFPYSSSADAIDDRNWSLVREAGDLGYLVIVSDTDSRDWERPGVNAVLRNMTPVGEAGAVVLLHDGGGDRAQTVAALERFIPTMRAAGYRFTTVSGGLARTQAHAAGNGGGNSGLAGNSPASTAEILRGATLVYSVQIANVLIRVLLALFVLVGLFTLVRMLLLFVLAGRNARHRRAPTWSWGPPVTEPVSVIVPAYNEREGIEATVRSLVASDYEGIEVIVVDDGSTDGTADIVEGLALPHVRVVRKVNAGKARALNTGLALASNDLIVTADADTVFERDAIRLLIQPFADPTVGAVSGNVKVGNRRSLLAKWQHIEYVIGFNLDRRLYEALGCMPTVPGAIAGFRRRALIEADGISDDTVAEDTDITIAIIRHGWRVVYEDRARAWTEAPTALRQLWRQRYRWSYGTLQAMWKHRRAVLDRGSSGRFGRRGLPLLAFFGVVLPLLAPLIDLMAIYGFFFLDRGQTVVAWVAMQVMQALTAVVAFRLDREKLRTLWALPIQQFVYRQLLYLVLIRSVVTAFTGVRLRWHKVQHTGVLGRRAAKHATVSVGTAAAGLSRPTATTRPSQPAATTRPSQPAIAAATGSGRPPVTATVRPARPPAAAAGGWAQPAPVTVAPPPEPPAVETTRAPRSPGRGLIPGTGRNRWFDVLRAVALARIFVYHVFTVAWLSYVFPAVGVMFAIAGSLMARSMQQSRTTAVTRRIRRLLPALWVLSIILVPAMLWLGWRPHPLGLLPWVVPIAEPPSDELGQPAAEVLWYLVTYLWLVLLSPAAMWLYRRQPVLAVLFPLAALVALEATPPPIGDTATSVATDVATFASCWILGFAHQDGALRRVPWKALAPVAGVVLVFGASWALTHPSDTGYDLNEVPIGQAFYSLGFVLLLLRVSPPTGWLSRVRILDRTVTTLNARAVTFYLWHNLAIAACFPIGDALGVVRLGTTGYVVLAVGLLLVVLLALGWVEDLAARRPVHLLPWRTSPGLRYSASPAPDSPTPGTAREGAYADKA